MQLFMASCVQQHFVICRNGLFCIWNIAYVFFITCFNNCFVRCLCNFYVMFFFTVCTCWMGESVIVHRSRLTPVKLLWLSSDINNYVMGYSDSMGIRVLQDCRMLPI